MSTFLELQDNVLGFRFSDTNYRTPVKAWLNRAQSDICLRTDLPTQFTTQTITTVAGTQSYDLAADYLRFGDLSYPADTRILERLELREFDDLAASSGTPTSYIIIGSTVRLYPTPDAVYSLTLRYYKLPAEMTDNGDEPEIPAEYHWVLEHYALARAYERESDVQLSGHHRTIYETELRKMAEQANYADHDQNTQVEGGWAEPAYHGGWY